ncbi:hypothetical protein BX600DRAFT_516151 [Xylariales sp. PMI_506]|nr:hypothetical protein BX600DRAFT_516151 [Xylariales sp. PMI_506]
MCTFYYLHYHHISPCTSPVEYSIQYNFCSEAPSVTAAPSVADLTCYPGFTSPLSQAMPSRAEEPQPQPCANLIYAPLHQQQQHQHQQQSRPSSEGRQRRRRRRSSGPAAVATSPCALAGGDGSGGDGPVGRGQGGCLTSMYCSSGGCRRDELGGRWRCCACGLGGNPYRWCVHPMRGIPDTLCYHVVCPGCEPDPLKA